MNGHEYLVIFIMYHSRWLTISLSLTHLTNAVFVQIFIVTKDGDFVWHGCTDTRPIVDLQKMIIYESVAAGATNTRDTHLNADRGDIPSQRRTGDSLSPSQRCRGPGQTGWGGGTGPKTASPSWSPPNTRLSRLLQDTTHARGHHMDVPVDLLFVSHLIENHDKCLMLLPTIISSFSSSLMTCIWKTDPSPGMWVREFLMTFSAYSPSSDPTRTICTTATRRG